MFKYILIFTLLSPFVGIVLMEMGAYGADVGMRGYPNGASFAYFIYMIFFFVFFVLVRNKKMYIDIELNNATITQKKIDVMFNLSIYILLLFLFLMLFVFGGINVLLGNLGKGVFRLNIGFFGFLAYMITKLFAPGILVLLTVLFKKYRYVYPSFRKKFYLCLLLVGIIGASWGFKSTAITLLIPSAIIFYDKVSFRKILAIGLITFLIFVSFSLLFDDRELNFNSDSNEITIENTIQVNDFSAFEFVLYRLTVMQGNSAWRVWDLYSSDVEMPNYWMTLTSVFGDKVLSLAGISHESSQDFISTHYSYLVTNLVTSSNNFLTFEHNVTSTAFSEGVIMGGVSGVIVFGSILGFLCGKIYNKIIIYYNRNEYVKLSL